MAGDKEPEVTNYLAKLRDPETHRFHSVTAREFLECWKHYDRDGNGYLDNAELDGFLKEFVRSVIPGDIGDEVVSEIALEQLKQEFMDAYDDNGDGRIDINELAQILPTDETFLALFQHEAPLSSSVEFMRVWKQFDADGSGYIEKDELRGFLKHLLEQSKLKINEEKLEDYTQIFLSLFDRDGDGRLQLSEMARLLPVKENYLIKPLFKNTDDVDRRTVDRIFRKYDTDGNGILENEELLGFLKDLLEATGEEFTESRMNQMKDAILEQWDANHDGKIDNGQTSRGYDLILRVSNHLLSWSKQRTSNHETPNRSHLSSPFELTQSRIYGKWIDNNHHSFYTYPTWSLKLGLFVQIK